MSEVQEDRSTGLCEFCNQEAKLHKTWDGRYICDNCLDNLNYEDE